MFSSPRLSNLSRLHPARLHLIALIFVCLFSETARAQDARDPLLGPPCTAANGCEVKEGWLEGPSGPFWAHYMLTDGQASIGDMLFSEKRDLSKRGAISRTASLWTGGVIPFAFAAGWTDAQEATIIGVINTISQQTVLTLRPRTTADANWVLIRPTTTPGVCGQSAVGRVGSGSQNLSLRASCLTNRTITHEFLHAAGLEHEHTRPDRNDFVNVDMTACTMGTAQCQVDYGRSTTTEAYGFGRYDFASILHYRANAVLAAKNGETLGGNTLTPGDLADLAALYEPLLGYPYERDGSGSTYTNDDRFGHEVTVGDFNGDGFDDFAAASKGLGVGAWQAEVTVVYGTAAGPSSANNSNIVFSDAISALASGDFNGDGIDDLAVGHNMATMNNRTQAGKVLILPGQASGFDCAPNGVYNRDCHSVQLNRSAKVYGQGTPFTRSHISEAYNHFGQSLAAGDFNGDGIADLAVGAPGDDVRTANDRAGSVAITFGSASSWLGGSRGYLMSQNSVGVLGNPENNDGFGSSLAAGNFDGDRYDDLVVGVPNEAIGAIGAAGLVNVLYGTSSGPTGSGSQGWHQDSPGIPGGCEANDRFGSVLTTGDFNGDTFMDLAIGVEGEDASGGAVNIIHGGSSGLSLFRAQMWHQGLSSIPGGIEAGDFFGSSLAAGDFNNDGRADLAIGIYREDLGSMVDAGGLIVLYAGLNGLSATGRQWFDQNTEGIRGANEAHDRFGESLAAGDFDNDGFSDLAVGIPGEDIPSYPNIGGVETILGGASGLSGRGAERWENGKQIGQPLPPGTGNPGTDTDGDGIPDSSDLDDDNDGFSDEDEIAAGTDPLNKWSFPLPDLQVPAFSVSLRTPAYGQHITLSATVKNAGKAASSATTLRYYWSTNMTISRGDPQVYAELLGDLAVAEVSSKTFLFTFQNVPKETTSFYLGACVDAISEISTANNCSAGVKITVSPPAKPTIDSFTASPSTIVAGAQATLNWTSTGATKCQIFTGLMSSQFLLPADGSATFAPTATTTYRVACQGAGGEAFKSVTVTVTQPANDFDGDGIPDSIDPDDDNDGFSDEDEIAAGTDPLNRLSYPRPDLQVPAFSVSLTTPTHGEGITLRATVKNNGQAASSATTLRYYRSTNSFISLGDTLIGTDLVGTLAPGGTSLETLNFTVPNATTSFYLGACRDLFPINGPATGRYCSAGVKVTVSPLPKPTIDFFTASPSTIVAGGQTTLTWASTEANKCEMQKQPIGFPFTVPLDGNTMRAPSSTTTYIIRCERSFPFEDALASVTVTVTQPANDFDGDGIPDPIDPDDDNDGYSDVEELRLGSHPKNAGNVPPTGLDPSTPTTLVNFNEHGGYMAYLANPANADLLQAGVSDAASAYNHWRTTGAAEARSFAWGHQRNDTTSGIPDPEYAIDGGFAWAFPGGNTVVVITADAPKPAGWDGPALLLSRGGVFNLGAHFTAQSYRANNPDVASAIDTGQVSNFASVTDHYVKYGFNEGRRTNGDWTQAQVDAWSDPGYLAANPDVLNYFQSAVNSGWKLFGKYGFSHWINFGQYEGRSDGQ